MTPKRRGHLEVVRRPRTLAEIYEPIRDEMAAAEAVLLEILAPETAPIGADVGALAGGGKRLRPAVAIASARLGPRQDPRLPALAALVEIVHLASLIHDDVLDEAATRRRSPTLNGLHGVPFAVLAGDLLYSTVFLRLLREMPLDVTRTVTEGARTMIEGEVRQNIAARPGADGLPRLLDEAAYEALIGAKTAAFFAACARAGALLGGATPAAVEAASTFGYRFGIAFQIADDVLDIAGAVEDLGKEIAADLRGGKVTLPVIRLVAARPEAKALVRRARDGEAGPLLALLGESGAIDEALATARAHAAAAVAALAPLPAGPARRLLEDLAAFAVDRTR